MRRIVNILAKMVSAIVLALIFLPLLVALLFEIPAAQNFVAREATEIISRKLGTRISIDRVDIGLFYRVSLDGFYVEDFQRDTLLYAGRLDARIKSLGLFGGGLVFSRAELSDARFCLRETPDGEMNIKQVVDKGQGPGGGKIQAGDRAPGNGGAGFLHGTAGAPQSVVRSGFRRYAPDRHSGRTEEFHH